MFHLTHCERGEHKAPICLDMRVSDRNYLQKPESLTVVLEAQGFSFTVVLEIRDLLQMDDDRIRRRTLGVR